MTAGRIWAASLAALFGSLALVAALHDPVLFDFYLAAGVFLWALVASFRAAMWHERAVAAEAELWFAERPVEYVGDKGTRLQLVPPRLDGSEHEWPRIARVLDIEAGEQG